MACLCASDCSLENSCTVHHRYDELFEPHQNFSVQSANTFMDRSCSFERACHHGILQKHLNVIKGSNWGGRVHLDRHKNNCHVKIKSGYHITS